MAADLAAGAAVSPPRYDVVVARSWAAGEPAFRAALADGDATPFQSARVTAAWYQAFAGDASIQPLLVSVRHGTTAAHVVDLALVRVRRGPVRIISFAGFDLVDCNAPVLGPGAPATGGEARALWRAILGALPRADLIDFRKMPPRIGERANPLALLRTLPCALNGNVVEIGEAYDAYMRGALRRVVRKELERSWRVFSRHPDARFCVATEPAARARVLAALEVQQPIRMGLAGKAYRLGAPHAAEFYRRLVASDPTSARVVLLALMAGEEVVAALMGLRQGRSFTMIRISSSADPAWTNCSPGRLVIERTMAHLHAEGVRVFDFSVGNYDYKRRFGVVASPLVDLVLPLTPLGLGGAARARALVWLRRHPGVDARLRRLLGRERPDEG